MFFNLKKFSRNVLISVPSFFVDYLRDKYSNYEHYTSNILSDLIKDGLYVFDEPLTHNDVLLLNQTLDQLFNDNPPSTYGQENNRVYSAGLVSDVLIDYVNKITPIIEQYLNTDKIKVEISYFQKSFPQESLDDVAGGDFHVDDNKANLKYFIYLTDVTDLNGPFSAVLGTSRWRLKWSFLRGLLWALTEKRKFFYDFLLDRKFCLDNETKITGKAGTHFIVDTTSAHRACQLKQGERRVVVISFNRA